MIEPEAFLEELEKQEVDFFTGVPDSLLKEFLAVLSCRVATEKHHICANEGNAVAVAAGYHLATGKTPLVYMQNSGLGNAVNPLMSLCHQAVYGLPLLLLIGWRGEPGQPDEPQHLAMGAATLQILQDLQIPYQILDAESQFGENIHSALATARTKSSPFALVCKKNVFRKSSLNSEMDLSLPLSRAEAVRLLLESAGEKAVVVSTTGYTSRELFGQRFQAGEKRARDFLNVGAMGHASQIAFGLAIASSSRQVLCLDGDGSAIMHMGNFATIGKAQPHNLKHVVLNNGVHDSVGGQPTAGLAIRSGRYR